MPELTGTHRNSPRTTSGTHPGTHLGIHPGTTLLYGFVVGASVAGAALIYFDRSLQVPNYRSLRLHASAYSPWL